MTPYLFSTTALPSSRGNNMLNVIYRICDIQSTNPPPIFAEDRFLLNLYCFQSFTKAFEGMDIKIHFLLDNSSSEWDKILAKCPFDYQLERSEKGIDYSFRIAMEIAREVHDDVLLQECDYYFLPNTGKEIEKAIQHFGFISHYDHPDKYPGMANLTVFNNRHWRTAVSTTTTFGARKDKIELFYDDLIKYGYLDHCKWVDLGNKGEQLFTPIPSIATHMVKDYIPSGVKWPW